MHRVFVTMGSNIAGEANMREAVRRLALRTHVLGVSHVYQTKPVGNPDQPDFLNAAVLLETDLSPSELKSRVLQVIEQELGRLRSSDKNGPRTIDLDIVLFGEQVLNVGPRHIPDPDILRYAHVAVPLADLAPDHRHPETGQTLQEIARTFAGQASVRRTTIDLHLGSERR